MSKFQRIILAGSTLIFGAPAFAAVPTEVTSAITDAATDAGTVGGLVLVVIVAIMAFKWIRRAF